jgi:hypothetical protein
LPTLFFLLVVFLAGLASGCLVQKAGAAGAEGAAAPERGSTLDVRCALEATIDRLIYAYETESADAFMAHVSPVFTGEKASFDTAVKDDFALFDQIDIQAGLSGFSANPKGFVHAALTYTRRVIAARSGELLADRGFTEMTFAVSADGFRLYSMKSPVLFGVSGASRIASGRVGAPPRSRLLVVKDGATPLVLPYEKAMENIEGLGGPPPH